MWLLKVGSNMRLYSLDNDQVLEFLMESWFETCYLQLEVFIDSKVDMLLKRVEEADEEFIVVAHIGTRLDNFIKLVEAVSKNKNFQSLVVLSCVDVQQLYVFKELMIQFGINNAHVINKGVGAKRICQMLKNIAFFSEASNEQREIECKKETVAAKIDFTKQQLIEFIKKGAFCPYLQPQICMDSRKVSSYELLVRMQLEGKIVYPGEFLHLFSKYNLMTELTLCLLESTFSYLRNIGLEVNLSVNVDTQSLHQIGFDLQLKRLLSKYGVNANMVTIEVTETLSDINTAVLANVLSLNLAGIKLAMDDFGVGYSSVDCLIKLPFTEIKLDRKHIAILTRSPKAYKVVAAMCSLAKEMGLLVVAEGIQSEKELYTVQALGVDKIQGFLISKAMPLPCLPTYNKTHAA